MKDHPGHFDSHDHVQKIMTVCPPPKKSGASPLGWSIKGRLIIAAAGAVSLWLAVAWAIGWLT